ncbi:hypothetical protein HMPREF9372_1991 [Sporosarcina newyorkensis 2681]|uniref:Uncharacterized protein n=1 Tax=Sporosarcina newyorkensis 2681 TaxID=1027292 RepID=F9DT60_9BACL|nr:hypothetical protein HMPREF9372_1991 [Sporosarcina newyorkensis 2681]
MNEAVGERSERLICLQRRKVWRERRMARTVVDYDDSMSI